jgi:hypothetical protein
MGCCGKSSTIRTAGVSSPVGASLTSSTYITPVAHFRCTGSSTVVVVGPVTGRMYRFPSSGATVQVDSRDALSFSRVRHLEAVRPAYHNSKTSPR